MAFFNPPTAIRDTGRALANRTTFEGYAEQLNEGEKLVVLADSKTNNSGHPMHVAPIIENADDYVTWMARWMDQSYYIIGHFAV